ncbi:MAG: nucleotidyltransferase domain-containing protein [Nanoarchaeota archaeon]|jgi:predicted nucleotidyltransferase/uncharacterized protein (UPF0332 family)|nr:nucleotidyltransferase domain-containing protein [Nanoarchaeota archaeon]
MEEVKQKRGRGRPKKNPEASVPNKQSTVNHQPSTKTDTLKILTDHEIATDFAIKAYKTFSKVIKSVVLFGSIEKKTISRNSDIDIVILIDDVSLDWGQEEIAWYREELDLLLRANPYVGKLHINTIKLTTWWDGLLKGDPVVLNVIRHGHVVLDAAGFVEPLKILLAQGKIKGTPETIYQCIQRAPNHLMRSKAAELSAVEGVYWSMVDSAHAALIAAGFFPPSPEHVMSDLKEGFVDRGLLKMKYVLWYKDIYYLHKKIDHKEIYNMKGIEIHKWQDRAEEFMEVMINLVEQIVSKK